VPDSFTHYFAMPIRVNVYYKDGTMQWNRQWVDGREANIDVPNPSSQAIDYVLFDPGNHILKDVEFNKSIDELKSQATKATELLDRYDAVEGMRNYGYYLKRQFFYDMFRKNPYFPIQQQIIQQMAPDSNAISMKIMLEALKDNDAVIRQEVFKNIPSIPDSLRPAFEALLHDSSINVVNEALKKLSELFPARLPMYLAQTNDKDIDGLANNLRISWLKLSSEQGNKDALLELEDYLSPLFEFRTRINAMKAISELDAWSPRSAYFLLQAASSWNGRLAAPAREIIKYVNADRRGLFHDAYNAHRWTDEEKTALSKLL
jgi:hypothetical protein